MTDRRTFTDEELTAYLDGEATPEDVAAIVAALDSDPAVEAQLRALEIPKAGIASAFAESLRDAPPAPDLAPPVGHSRKAGFLLAASFCVCLVFSGVIGAAIQRNVEPDWMEMAAAYQALYVEETVATASPTADETTAQLARVSDALGKDLAAVATVTRASFKRAQILGHAGKPLIQIAFLSKAGAPIALCIYENDSGRSSEATISRMHALASATWEREGYQYLLIGGEDEALIGKMADDFRALL